MQNHPFANVIPIFVSKKTKGKHYEKNTLETLHLLAD